MHLESEFLFQPTCDMSCCGSILPFLHWAVGDFLNLDTSLLGDLSLDGGTTFWLLVILTSEGISMLTNSSGFSSHKRLYLHKKTHKLSHL